MEKINAGLTQAMTSVAFLKDLPNMKSIKFLGEKIVDLETLENAKSLESIIFWSHPFDLDGNKIGKAKSLKNLKFWGTDSVINWEGLANLTELEELVIDAVEGCNTASNPIDASFVASLTKLNTLSFSSVEVKNLKLGSALQELSLEKVNNQSGNAIDVSTLASPELTTLEIKNCKVINAEKILTYCPKIEKITLQNLEGIASYDFLRELPEMTSVTLSEGAITEEFEKELKNIDLNMW